MALLAPPSGSLSLMAQTPRVQAGEVEVAIGESFGPLVWAEWTGSDAAKRVWASVDLPDPASYYEGFKEAKLLTPGTVSRELSDEKGEYQSQSFSVTVDDSDYDIRTLLGQNDTRRLIINTLIVMRMISDEDRRALLTPRTVGIGLVRGYTLE